MDANLDGVISAEEAAPRISELRAIDVLELRSHTASAAARCIWRTPSSVATAADVEIERLLSVSRPAF